MTTDELIDLMEGPFPLADITNPLGEPPPMRVCIVGNGPSAEGHGAEIDACDFVVRIKAWWVFAAKDAGSRCDALAHYGWGNWEERPAFDGEHWITQTVSQIENHPDGWKRLQFITYTAELRPIRWLPGPMWDRLVYHIGSHPSTGMVAVAIAMETARPDELVLCGFDATTEDASFFGDARGNAWPGDHGNHHDWVKEKLALKGIREGTWLGQPTKTKLEWIGEPVC